MSTPQRSYAKTYEQAAGTSGSVATVTLAKPSFDVTVQNVSATSTDSFDVQFNGSSAKIRLVATAALATFRVTDFCVTSVSITAVSGTPGYQIIAFEESTT